MPPVIPTTLTLDDLKRVAAHHAVDQIKSGMIVGLGTGSTAIHALHRISHLLRLGTLTDIIGIPTSTQTESQARALGIPLSDLDSHPIVDLSIDGADEVDPHLNLIKGRGGSLLREKLIEAASNRFVVIVDETKMVDVLGGSGMAVPVEVIPFCANFIMGKLRKVFEGVAGFRLRLRCVGGDERVPAVTDNMNYVVDLFFEEGIRSEDLGGVSEEILKIVGVVEHGMFLGMASSVIVAGRDGGVVEICRTGARRVIVLSG